MVRWWIYKELAKVCLIALICIVTWLRSNPCWRESCFEIKRVNQLALFQNSARRLRGLQKASGEATSEPKLKICIFLDLVLLASWYLPPARSLPPHSDASWLLLRGAIISDSDRPAQLSVLLFHICREKVLGHECFLTGGQVRERESLLVGGELPFSFASPPLTNFCNQLRAKIHTLALNCKGIQLHHWRKWNPLYIWPFSLLSSLVISENYHELSFNVHSNAILRLNHHLCADTPSQKLTCFSL